MSRAFCEGKMHYTIHQDSKIDRKVEQDVEYIAREVGNLLGDKIHSILLCGGFGRGEGSVEVRNGEVHIVNDYDISVVLTERSRFRYPLLHRRLHPQLQRLAERLANELKMKQIDLDLKHLSYFDNQPLKIENYEVLKGHMLLCGDEDPCQYMPDYKAEDIPLSEGTWLFRNRGGGLLIAARYFLDSDRIISEKKRENFVIECSKAILAMGDSILLLKRQYHHLHRKRLEVIRRLDSSDISDASVIVPRYIEALEQKLKPDFERFYCQDMVKWWFEITELFGRFYRYFESQRLKVNFKDWIEYAELRKRDHKIDRRRLLGVLMRREINPFSFRSIRRGILRAERSGLIGLMALLLFSIRKDGFYQPYLEKATEMLGMKLEGSLLEDWRRLTSIFFRLWHPAGEAAKVTDEIVQAALRS